MRKNAGMWLALVVLLSLGLGVVGTSSGKPAAASKSASATLEPKSGSTITGKAKFEEKKGEVVITVEIKGAKPGPHGIHLHETGDCSDPAAKTAGGHFNPDKMNHGAPDKDPHHAGDLGNIMVGANGTGKLKITVKGLTVSPGDHSVVGRALVVHAGQDDLTSQPAGNSGDRYSCGAVKADGGM